jgi:AcrR family transcriptional regulator
MLLRFINHVIFLYDAGYSQSLKYQGWKIDTMAMGIRAQQKEKTRRSLIDAAFRQLSAERSFSSLSLREVAREAGIAPTSFYRHFRDMEELGLTMVDEGGLLLRQLMRQARQRIAKEGSVIRTSVNTFMEFIESSPNVFRLLLRERSGTSAEFRAAVAREMQHFSAELTEYLISTGMSRDEAFTQAEASVILVFSSGAEALDLEKNARDELTERLVMQLRMISKGAYWYRKEREKQQDRT